MKLLVDEVEGVGITGDKNICVRLSGEDIKFVATEYSISLFVDEDIADKIAFQINAIIEDRSRRYAEKIINK